MIDKLDADVLQYDGYSAEMRDFARVLKAALIMIVRYLERRYRV